MTNTDAGGGWSDPTASAGGGAAKDMVRDAAQTVKQEAATFAAGAKEQAAGHIEQHKETATRTLGDFADAIRKAGDELAQKDQTLAGRLIVQAADGLESLSRSVSDKRPEELLDAVRDFGRRNPTAFIAGSVLAGLAIGRFLRSTSPQSGAQGFGAEFTAPGGAAPAEPLACDDFHSDEGGDLTTAGAASDGTDISLAGDALDGDDRDDARFRPPGV
jgi:hypothetical protein